LSALSILKKLHWIDADKLIEFILSAQDVPESERASSGGGGNDGGIADRPGDVSDVFHTCFGLVGTFPSTFPLLVHRFLPFSS
jgi:geranylgeranyl transferase type-2 subunit beta